MDSNELPTDSGGYQTRSTTNRANDENAQEAPVIKRPVILQSRVRLVLVDPELVIPSVPLKTEITDDNGSNGASSDTQMDIEAEPLQVEPQPMEVETERVKVKTKPLKVRFAEEEEEPEEHEIPAVLGDEDDEVDDIVGDLCQMNFEQSLGVLQGEVLDETNTLLGMNPQEDGGEDLDTDSDSDSESLDEDDDDDGDEEYGAKRTRRRARVKAKADLSNSRRTIRGKIGGIGTTITRRKNARTFGEEDHIDDMEAVFEYRRKTRNPLEMCPPPPPSKMKGGRKALRKRTMENEIPEEAIKEMAACIISRQDVLPKEVVVVESTLGDPTKCSLAGPFKYPVLQHMMIQREAQATAEALQPDNLASAQRDLSSILGSSSSKPQMKSLFDISFATRHLLPLKTQLRIEQFCSILYAYHQYQSQRVPQDDDDPSADANSILVPKFSNTVSKMMMQTARDKKLRHWKFWNPEKIDYKTLFSDVGNNYLGNATTIASVEECLLKASNAITEYSEELTAIQRAKEFIQYDLENLHKKLSCVDPKVDELSITGIRQIKVLLNAPYFKTMDGLMCPDFSDPLCKLPYLFRTDKQKWTRKDLLALAACVKESLIERATQFVEARYQELQDKCKKRAGLEIMDDDKCVDEFNQPIRRRRGRPSNAEVEKRDKYGSITPVLCRLPGNIEVSYRMTPKQLGDWRNRKEKRWRGMSYEYAVNELSSQFPINWYDVCEKLMMRTKKLRSPDDCMLAFKHEIDPKVDSKRFGKEEDNQLKTVCENTQFKNNWTLITAEMNRISKNQKALRTSFYLFTRYKVLYPTPRLEWTPEMDSKLRSLVAEHPGDWRMIAVEMNHDRISKRQVTERYKKALNPMLRNGAFTRVEDALLLLTIERLKPFLLAEGHFGSVLAYLPWRYETTWRDRANNLFNDWIVPWTLEEDLRLLELAVLYKRNWQKISEQFTSFKNRKGCLTRYKILDRHLKDKRFKANSVRESLEFYHEAYSMTRYNVFQYRHLGEVLELLVRMLDFNLDKEKKAMLDKYPFTGLDPTREPDENELRHMLLAFDFDILRSTIKSLRTYKSSRDAYWKDWIREHGTQKRTFDRRTFHKDIPQSVASAMHIRGLKLKKKQEVEGPPLNEFEEDVYLHFNRFSRTKPVRASADRRYLPSPADLIQWSRVSRIVATTLDEVSSFSGPCNKKWEKKGETKIPKTSQGRGKGKKGLGTKSKRAKHDDDTSTSDSSDENDDFSDESDD